MNFLRITVNRKAVAAGILSTLDRAVNLRG